MGQLMARGEYEEAERVAGNARGKNQRVLALEDLARFYLDQSVEQVAKKMAVVAQDDVTPTFVFNKLMEKIDSQSPYSLIRLGDGEGNLLAYPVFKKDYPHAVRLFADQMLNVWFGRDRDFDSPEFCEQIMPRMLNAIHDADIIGVMHLGIKHDVELRSVPQHLRRRAYTGIAANIGYLYNNKCSQHGRLLSRVGIHIQLAELNFYQAMFKTIPTCSVVTCIPALSSAIESKFGLTDVRSFIVPERKASSKVFGFSHDEKHYPDVYNRLLDSLRPRFKGEVFLVAAGPLAKIYCGVIKRCGGIAIDIGSMADWWLGYHTRVQHDDSEWSKSMEILKR